MCLWVYVCCVCVCMTSSNQHLHSVRVCTRAIEQNCNYLNSDLKHGCTYKSTYLSVPAETFTLSRDTSLLHAHSRTFVYYASIYTRTYTYVGTCIHLYIHTHIQVHTNMQIVLCYFRIYIYIHASMNSYALMSTCACTEHMYLPWFRLCNVMNCLENLSEHGFWCLCQEMKLGRQTDHHKFQMNTCMYACVHPCMLTMVDW
jgi:hypothetical protein